MATDGRTGKVKNPLSFAVTVPFATPTLKTPKRALTSTRTCAPCIVWPTTENSRVSMTVPFAGARITVCAGKGLGLGYGFG